MRGFVVTGTDTDIGKTVFCAGLASALQASYWKPVQAGLDGETDSQTVARLGALPSHRILAEAYRLNTPASPHHAAALDGVEIDVDGLTIPPCDRPLIIEGAGGLLVPLTRNRVLADVLACWQWPVIVCARTGLGTINHTLLTIEALRNRAIPIAGIAFIGDAVPHTQQVVADMSGVRMLGRLPRLNPLTPTTLATAFRDNVNLAALQGLC